MAGTCSRCAGCGQIADTEEGEPWAYWADLPAQSAAAVLMGVVKPIPCPQCDGFGRVLNANALPDLYRACRSVKMTLAPYLTETDDFDNLYLKVSEALNKARGE